LFYFFKNIKKFESSILSLQCNLHNILFIRKRNLKAGLTSQLNLKAQEEGKGWAEQLSECGASLPTRDHREGVCPMDGTPSGVCMKSLDIFSISI
jgi:hypothetical protein